MQLQAADTLVCDTARIARWQSDPAYDYNRELLTPELDVFELLRRWISELLRKIFGSRFAEEYSGVILIGLAILILLLLLWFLYKKRPELFTRTRKNQVAYHVREDTIYGIDFQKEMDGAVARSDYREAVRLLYLQTLKLLSDSESIDWQPYKTPTEYIYEIKDDTVKTPFRKLTTRFLRVRYGNFDATSLLYDEMYSLQKAIREGGAV